MQFSHFPLDPRLTRGLDALGYVTCTPVQEATLKAVLETNKDVYAQSQTGTGKTAAFLVATFMHLIKPENNDKFALILAPTRELAVQIEKEAQSIGKFLNLSMVAIYGGTAYEKQLNSVKKNPRLIIATPGRLLDFANQKAINLKNAGVLVIDEADRLFDMGFHQDLLKIIKMLPSPQQRLNLLFSATLNNKVGQLAWEHMNNPESIVIKAQYPTVEGIEQRLFHVGRAEKMVLLLALLKKENPNNAIIFSNTKAGARQIAKRLQEAGYHCALIEGDIHQKKRLKIIQNMKDGHIKFLSATDIASRGLHIPNLDLVVNFDLPDDAENYVHRIGRTARGSQKTGLAISFACERFVYNLSSIEKLIKRKIPVTIIDEELQKAIDTIIKEQPKIATPPSSDLKTHHPHRKTTHSSRDRNDRRSTGGRPSSRHTGKRTEERPSGTNEHGKKEFVKSSSSGSRGQYKNRHEHDKPRDHGSPRSPRSQESYSKSRTNNSADPKRSNTHSSSRQEFNKEFSRGKQGINTSNRRQEDRSDGRSHTKKDQPAKSQHANSTHKSTSMKENGSKNKGIFSFINNFFKKEES